MKRWATFAALALPILLNGCFTFSSFQSAHIVQPGEPTATISIARTTYLDDDDEDEGWALVEFANRYGIGARFDWAWKLSFLVRNATSSGGAVLGLDLRRGVYKDYFAVALPVSAFLGDYEFHTLQAQPGVIATVPLTERVEITGAARNVSFCPRARALHFRVQPRGRHRFRIRHVDAAPRDRLASLHRKRKLLHAIRARLGVAHAIIQTQAQGLNDTSSRWLTL